jgi:hypothetical protein
LRYSGEPVANLLSPTADLDYGLFTLDSNPFAGTFPLRNLRSKTNVTRIGLCASCCHTRRITSRKGRTYYLCDLSAGHEGYPKYPLLPVLSCTGYIATHFGAERLAGPRQEANPGTRLLPDDPGRAG